MSSSTKLKLLKKQLSKLDIFSHLVLVKQDLKSLVLILGLVVMLIHYLLVRKSKLSLVSVIFEILLTLLRFFKQM